MPLLSRLPNILSSSLSSAPQEPSQNELKTRTLDLELTISRLREQWQAERKEWVGDCETVMACHRIAHLQKNVLLAQERVVLEHERDLTRKERVAVIQRDFNLILFKAREKELEIELKEKATLLHDAEKAREVAEVRCSTFPIDIELQLFLCSNRPTICKPSLWPCRLNSLQLVKTWMG